MARLRRLAPVFGLFLLAPFVGEFLLGNVAISSVGLLILLAPLYGCGALLVREVARRIGAGWPTMVLFAAAYALIEEGPVDQLLWNDSYAGHDYLSGDSYIPALGMSVELTQGVLALHTIWSICVPIAIVESFVRGRRTTPWLGRTGLIVTAAIYLLGAVFVFFGNYSEEHFLASPAQLIGISIVIVGLLIIGYRLRGWRQPPIEKPAPSPWLVGVVALLATSVYWGPSALVTAGWYEWIGVVVWFVVMIGGAMLVLWWSRHQGWDARHVFALAAGAMLTYVWAAFPVKPEDGEYSTAIDIGGNVVFGAIALLILWRAGRVVAREPQAA